MQPKTRKSLEDIALYANFVLGQMATRTPADYASDLLVRSAVERGFEIIGEALIRIVRNDPDVALRISDIRKIIGFRNRLVHGYDTTDHEVVWAIIQDSLPTLRTEVEALLGEAEAPDDDAR